MDTRKKYVFIAKPEEKTIWFQLFSGKMKELVGDLPSPTLRNAPSPTLRNAPSPALRNVHSPTLRNVSSSTSSPDLLRIHRLKDRSPTEPYLTLKSRKSKTEDDEGLVCEMVEGFDIPPWDPDNTTNECVSCSAKFSTTNRRHHCRNCGHIYCNKCTQKRAFLPRYGLTKKKVRVCERCFLSH
eukprot:TRINITY_DN1394_c0_g1_i3.p1 TRINITY_DN1394_c0_g1~~TRINITY_DN1394_c0_g1_i3.p1  ORF type:complete len:183 (-),score=21.10 TRINITY_DN1394_c0_g1_i3:27-575(-)